MLQGSLLTPFSSVSLREGREGWYRQEPGASISHRKPCLQYQVYPREGVIHFKVLLDSDSHYAGASPLPHYALKPPQVTQCFQTCPGGPTLLLQLLLLLVGALVLRSLLLLHRPLHGRSVGGAGGDLDWRPADRQIEGQTDRPGRKS